MTFTINAVDSEFAVATGANVNSGAGTSTFDYPPTSSMDLVITSNPGDPSPGTFSVGDTYDLSYGNGGGGKSATFEDAVVLRSDALPGGGHAVVFEGTNADGAVEQIVWSPNFDLETWYFDNFSGGQSPGFYTSDQDPGTQYAHSFVCFSAETMITAARGEVPVGDLAVGDLVQTMDRGLQPILWIGRRRVRVDQVRDGAQPIEIQPKAIPGGGLRRPVVVSPQHRLLMRTETGQETLAPAKAFVHLKGVRAMRGKSEIEYITLLFAQHHILDVSGLAAESFLPGPEGFRLLSGRERLEVGRALKVAGTEAEDMGMAAARPCIGGNAGKRALRNGAQLASFDAGHRELAQAG